jgi:hypothetical protein
MNDDILSRAMPGSSDPLEPTPLGLQVGGGAVITARRSPPIYRESLATLGLVGLALLAVPVVLAVQLLDELQLLIDRASDKFAQWRDK